MRSIFAALAFVVLPLTALAGAPPVSRTPT
jgi:hypothetical protein